MITGLWRPDLKEAEGGERIIAASPESLVTMKKLNFSIDLHMKLCPS
jgi:hypothetical protein